MRLSDVFLSLGEETFARLVHGVSIGKLRTYQLYEAFKTRAHLGKVNVESLRRASPRFWTRMTEHDEDFAKELAQAILISQLELIHAVLDFLGIPNENGFFAKDIDAAGHLSDGWQQRVWDKFHGVYPEEVLRLYINHLAWELQKEAGIFTPAA